MCLKSAVLGIEPTTQTLRARRGECFPANKLFLSIIFFGKSSIDRGNESLPCGFYSDSLKRCMCVPAILTKYQKRISGPLLDHIDIHIEVPRVDYEKLSGDQMGETSEAIRNRVQAALLAQEKTRPGPASLTTAK